jgi:mannose-6-phosphate isomerase-like protein (cupin superfamily)
MEKVSVDDVTNDPHPMGVNTERSPLSAALGAEDVAVVHYSLAPGEQFSGGLHTHHDQEELFYVLEGTATFEHRGYDDAPEGNPTGGTTKTEVSAGEVIRFEPKEFQCGRNESGDRVVGLAIAAPSSRHDWEQIESFAPCPECDEVTSHFVLEPTDGFGLRCDECDNELRLA